MRNLRNLRWALLLYAAFDLFFGGVCGGFLPLMPLAAAQFTTVSGTVTDPNGLPYANGTISATLVISASAVFTATNQPYTPPTQPVGLSPTGSFVMQLADVTALTPGGGTYSFTVSCAAGCIPVSGGKGPVSFAVTGITISGVSQSITTQLTAAAVALSLGGIGAAGNVLHVDASQVVHVCCGASGGNIAIDNASLGTGTVGAAGNLLRDAATGGVTLTSTSGDSTLAAGGSAGDARLLTAGATKNVYLDSAQGLIFADTATKGNEAGLIRAGNGCRVTADITLTVNTPTTVCSWSLPAVAKAWAWQCQLPWAITAGTGTNTIAINVNYTQTPTAATGTETEIKTSNTNTALELWTALSATGSTTLLTSGTITPNALPFAASTSGTLLASATAGTFAIQMTAAGTTVTAAAKAGGTCQLY